MFRVFWIIFCLVIVVLLWMVIGSILLLFGLLSLFRWVWIELIIIGFIILRWDGLNVSVRCIRLLLVWKLDEKFMWYFMLFVLRCFLCLLVNLLNKFCGFLFSMFISMFRWLWCVILRIILWVLLLLVWWIIFLSIGINVLLFFSEKCFVLGNFVLR